MFRSNWRYEPNFVFAEFASYFIIQVVIFCTFVSFSLQYHRSILQSLIFEILPFGDVNKSGAETVKNN